METINGESVATNDATGQKVVFRGGKWIPYTPAPSTASDQPSGFQKYFANPATDILARGLTNMVPGLPTPQNVQQFSQKQASPWAQAAAGAIVPQDPRQAGIDAGTIGALLATGGTASLPLLLGSAMAGGAAGGAIQDPDSAVMGGVKGAALGAGETVVPEVLGAGARMVGRAVTGGASGLLDKVAGNLGETIGSQLPWLDPIKDVRGLYRAFGRGEKSDAVGLAGDLLSATKKDIASKLPAGLTMTVPVIENGKIASKALPFEDADAALSEFGDRGWLLTGDPRGSVAAPLYRDTARAARNQIANQLEMQQPGLGTQYLTARRQFASTKRLQELFSEKDAFTTIRGKTVLNQPKLADLLGREYYSDIARTMGKDGADKLVGAVSHGGDVMGFDVPGQHAFARIHGGVGMPGFSVHPGASFAPARGPNLPWYFARKPLPQGVANLLMGQPTGNALSGAGQ